MKRPAPKKIIPFRTGFNELVIYFLFDIRLEIFDTPRARNENRKRVVMVLYEDTGR